MRQVDLLPDEAYKLNFDRLKHVVDEKTKAILFTNPNNPTGELLEQGEMDKFLVIAKKVDA